MYDERQQDKKTAYLHAGAGGTRLFRMKNRWYMSTISAQCERSKSVV
jgi:hypothetical protein